MSTLPTTPIGKQQLIDMKAGAILRDNARKSERYLGCPIRLLLTFIVLIKSSLLCAWLVREYYYFNFRCSLLTSSLNDDTHRRRSIGDDLSLHIAVLGTTNDTALPIDYVDEQFIPLLKRSPPRLQQDVRSYHRRKFTKGKKANVVKEQSDIPTTVITLTNTQMIPVDGDTIRMKTIRNRVKPMSDVTNKNKKQLTEKEKKRKGKEKKKKMKKKKKEELKQTTTLPTSTQTASTKKRKGHKRKHNKSQERSGITEQTKLPRHLLSSHNLPHHTTPRPHQSSFLHGAIDPKDSSFSNKGQIRGYPMFVASRKPTPSSRLSEETRLLWEMDELNYTTHIAAAKTTAMTEMERNKNEDTSIVSAVQLVVPPTTQQTTTEEPWEPRKTFYDAHGMPIWKLTTTSFTVTTTTAITSMIPPTTRTPWIPKGIQTEEEKLLEERMRGRIPVEQKHREISTLEQLNNNQNAQSSTSDQDQTTPRPRPVKHGFDRSFDEAIDAGVFNYPPEKTRKETKPKHTTNDFLVHLAAFSSSATCIARTTFDLWSACQLLALFLCLIGVCAARRSLFVSHLVLDILLLVIGFVYTITMIVFSIVLYLMIGETPKEVLFKWILFALLLDAVLLVYGCLVVISFRCCERIVQSRLSMKLETPSSQAKPQSL